MWRMLFSDELKNLFPTILPIAAYQTLKKKLDTHFPRLTLFHLTYNMKIKVTQSCPTFCDPMDYTGHGILQARILEWVASHSLLQGILPTQGSNPGLSHCRRFLLSYKGRLTYNTPQYFVSAFPVVYFYGIDIDRR